MSSGRLAAVVVPHALADTVLARAQSRIANETAKRDRMRNGELGLDIYTMRPRLAEKGLRYFDSPEDVRD